MSVRCHPNIVVTACNQIAPVSVEADKSGFSGFKSVRDYELFYYQCRGAFIISYNVHTLNVQWV